MAINQHHLFEDLDGVKCSIVEKNATTARVQFLKSLLGFNGYTIVVVPSPPPKAAPAAPDAPDAAVQAEAPPAPETFTIGVTDLLFNPTNAVFGRLLRTPDGRVVTLAYWDQEEDVSSENVPYFYRHP